MDTNEEIRDLLIEIADSLSIICASQKRLVGAGENVSQFFFDERARSDREDELRVLQEQQDEDMNNKVSWIGSDYE